MSYDDGNERKRGILAGRAELFGRLGAYVRRGDLYIRYWLTRRQRAIGKIKSRSNEPAIIRAGYMSQSRGLAWDRRSRRKRK